MAESLYTADETAHLNQLQTDYNTKNQAYLDEKKNNDLGHAYLNVGTWIFPYSNAQTDEGSFRNWLALSDAALPVKLAAAKTAKSDYDTEVSRLETKYNQTFQNNHPQEYLQQQQQALQAAKDAANDANKVNYMSKTAKYIIIAVVVLGIVGVVLYFKYRKK